MNCYKNKNEQCENKIENLLKERKKLLHDPEWNRTPRRWARCEHLIPSAIHDSKKNRFKPKHIRHPFQHS